ncbi:hypothetical protein [Nocardia brevicatena]|uniref:hypothetical protein n=1 Tax=Nocardia brevicatena TaxID=37327 RepID=UPI001C3F3CEA|nr:hypothetical protein [Nocardia brevicatena]
MTRPGCTAGTSAAWPTRRRLVVRLRVRRWFCDTPPCGVRTFVEQVEGVTVRHGQRTPLLRAMLEGIAIAPAGQAGARLATALHVLASRSTLLRLLEALPDPATETPRVLGVDDFALRRGQNYGTAPDRLRDRCAAGVVAGQRRSTLANWPAAHPGVEVVCRDHSESYVEGTRIGAPARCRSRAGFTSGENMGKAVERCVARHRYCLRSIEPQPADPYDRE